MKLSDRACKTAKPRDKHYKLSDGGGLDLLIRKNGSKLWQMKYRFNKKEKTLSIGQGDCLIVTKLDRLARSVVHLGEIVKLIQDKKADLKILNLGIDTSTATGKLILNVIGSISEFEREMMLERQREGIAKAKAQGNYKGRAPTARAKSDEVKELVAQNVGATEIARKLGIGRASVYRIMAD